MALRAITAPAQKPVPKKVTKRGGGDARRFATDWIVEDYLALCRDPLSDLQRWLDEDRKKPSIHRLPPEVSHARHDAATHVAQRFCPDALHEVSGRIRANVDGGANVSDVSGRSGDGLSEHCQLQQVQGERGVRRGLPGGGTDPPPQGEHPALPVSHRPGAGIRHYHQLRSFRAPQGLDARAAGAENHSYSHSHSQALSVSKGVAPPSLASELAAAMGEFASRIAAVAGQAMSQAERALLIQAIKDEQTLAAQAIMQRHEKHSKNSEQRRPERPGRPNGNRSRPESPGPRR
jgi:hypothetical protein